jgi:SulP family sulfate permease
VLGVIIEDGRAHILQDKDIPDFAAVYRIHGPFLFGVTDKINTITDHLSSPAPMVILRLRNMTAIDATGIAELEELADQLQKSGRSMLLYARRIDSGPVAQSPDHRPSILRSGLPGAVR